MNKNAFSTLGMAGNYNKNSRHQLSIINSMKNFIHLGIDHLDLPTSSSPLIIADYGSSHGKNSIEAMKIILSYLEKTSKYNGSILIIHNDLPTNDWTQLFQLLCRDKLYYSLASGQSFYEQCLPSNSLTIGFSSASIHWLSRIPCHITNHCFHTYANDEEREMFKDQAKEDYNIFIEHRSKELCPGGILILSCIAVNQQGRTWFNEHADILYACAKILFTPQELENLTIPVYLRSLSELIDDELFNRCSLKLIKTELVQVNLPFLDDCDLEQVNVDQFIEIMTNLVYTIMGSIIKQVLENNERSKEDAEQLINQFWSMYEKKLEEKVHLLIMNNQAEYVYLIVKKI